MKRKIVLAATVVLAGFAVWFGAREMLSYEFLMEQEQQLRAEIANQPWRSFAIGFVLYTVISMLPGTSGKSVVCGWLFGFLPALVMVTGALTLAGLGGFSISRFILRDLIQKRLSGPLERVDRALEREGSFYLLTVRMLHVPFTLVNYLSGGSGVRMRTFAWTTFVGLIPSTMVFVGVGAGLPTLEMLEQKGVKGLLEPHLAVALVAMGGLPFVVRLVLRRLGLATEVDFSDGPSIDDDDRAMASRL